MLLYKGKETLQLIQTLQHARLRNSTTQGVHKEDS